MFRKPMFATVLAMLAAPALAGTYDAASTAHGTETSTVSPVGDDLLVIRTSSEFSAFETDADDSPLAGLKGPCFGQILVKAGIPSGGGLCLYTDANGDKLVIDWTVDTLTPDGRRHGTWVTAGGTGRFAGATGGGRFDAGTDAGGAYTNVITGEVNTP